MNNIFVYDFECFPHNWSVVFKNIETQELIVIKDDIWTLEQFTKYNQHAIFVGYNNQGYDRFIWDSILSGWNPYVVSKKIIIDKLFGWQFYKTFKYSLYQYDILQHLPSKVSLKVLEGNMGWDIQESEIPFDLDRPLTEKEWKKVIKYNIHDVNATEKVFWETQETFTSHLILIQMFKLPLTALGKTTANLAATILRANKQELWKNQITPMIMDKDYYEAPTNIQLSKYRFIQDYFGNEISDDFESKTVMIANTEHVIGTGGLHGDSKVHYYESDNEYLLIMLDAEAYYPNTMILYNMLSRSVSDPTRYKGILDWRIKAKNDGDEHTSAALKLVVNITYGASGAPFNALFDPRMRKAVCITGQLFLIDLIERIEPLINNLPQSNTDGILININRQNLNQLSSLIDEWETRTGYKLETTYVKRIWQKDTNNYVLETLDGKVKSKGAYVRDKSIEMNSSMIINEAIKAYFLQNINPKDYIHQQHSLDKFQMIAKSGRTYKGEFQQIKNEFVPLNQRVNRVFATTLEDYGSIYKQKPDKETYEKIANLPDNCLIINDDIQDSTNYDLNDLLDYDFYIQKTWKRIQEFLVD